MEVFVKKCRPLATEDESNSGRIFLKSDGTPFQKGTIRNRISSLILKNGIHFEQPISATNFRKWIVTEMKKKKKRMDQQVDEDLLQRLM